MAEARNGPQLTWANLVASAGVVALIVGGAWTFFQTQMRSLQDLLQTEVKAAREQIDLTRSGYNKRDDEIRAEIIKIREELIARRSEFPTQFEFKQFEKNADDRWRTQADINKQAIDAYLATKAWDAWRAERDKLILQLERRLDRLESK